MGVESGCQEAVTKGGKEEGKGNGTKGKARVHKPRGLQSTKEWVVRSFYSPQLDDVPCSELCLEEGLVAKSGGATGNLEICKAPRGRNE